MLKKNLSIVFIIILFILSIVFFIPHNKILKVLNIEKPNKITLENEITIEIKDLQCFDKNFTKENSILANKLNITEVDAYILGNLGYYWTKNLLENRKVIVQNNNIIFSRNSYADKLFYSGFCFKDSKPTNLSIYNKKFKDIRKGKYRVLDLDTQNIYKPDDVKVKLLKNFLVLKTYSIPFKTLNNYNIKTKKEYQTSIKKGNVKVILTDFTKQLKPNCNCKTEICQEILYNIKNAKKTIDIALYGYSRVYEIEQALIDALNKGVEIRFVYDSNAKGENIYPHTKDLTNILKNNISDINSTEANRLMHNKFYIFDNEILITGSANLSQTDMSGYNTNSIIVIKSPEIAQIYKQEFEQMYSGKFHNEKTSSILSKYNVSKLPLQIGFSPQNKGIEKIILPIINQSKQYIYIPIFVLTEKSITEALINAKKRGVDVKIIMDALNSSTKHSKIKELRQAGIPVKAENYAGKMHSKSMIVDNKYTIISSMNFSNSGENHNDENFVVIEDKDIAMMYKEFFNYQWDKIDNKWLKYNVRAESIDSIGSCSDGIDNNYDGLIDSADPNCKVL